VRLSFLFLLLLGFSALGQNTFPPVGQWREHLPYGSAIDLAASENKIYAATPYSLFSVDRTSGEIVRYSKVSGLSETGISAIQYDPQSGKLYVAYSNSNIDVLHASGIVNIPDIKRETISGDKNIYSIYTGNGKVYLSTGLGVIVLDGARNEVSETWLIGRQGGYVKTNAFTTWEGHYYAATEEGLKRTPVSNPIPADFNTWENLSGSQGLSFAPARWVTTLGSRLVMLQHDTVFVQNGGSWQPLFANDWNTLSIQASGNELLVTQRRPNGAAQVVILDANGTVLQTLQQPGVISMPLRAIASGDAYWVADLFGGLSRHSGGSYESFLPNSPQNIALGQLQVRDNILYAAAGAVNDAWNYLYNRSGFFRYAGGDWRAFNGFSFSQLDSLLDVITVAADPRDGSVWAGSFGGGLIHLKAGDVIDIFKQNSPLRAPIGDPLSYRVSGLAFDTENNLWITNFGASQQLHVLKADGSWQSFTVPFFLNENAVSQVLIDDAGMKWIVSPLGNGLIVFDDNRTIDDLSDDKWRMYRFGPGMGNLPSNDVTSLVKDKSGFIWVGTSDGIAVIQCPSEAFITGCEAVLPVIREGAFANYLFKGEGVRGMAVDGADRKWVATAGGAWLIAPDGDKVLAHFTESNAPLLSNDVRSIAIDGKTGEVYLATAKGIASFRGTATEAAADKGNVLVFPNPVPPDYNGVIAIKGLPENAFAKITELNGRLVYQARTTGGQLVWNGRDYAGRRAATGIYLVIVADETREEKAVAKIVFISR